jgi:hypothetical protein
MLLLKEVNKEEASEPEAVVEIEAVEEEVDVEVVVVQVV